MKLGRQLGLLAAPLLWLSLTQGAFAGISSENVIVVVNADSVVSRTIANHYAELRNIPTGNMVLLSGVPKKLKISLEDFKSKILTPLLEQLNRRGLSSQARVIAYSADFPTSVDISPHVEKVIDETVKKYQSATASINGATFFYRFIQRDSADYLNWGANLYSRSHFARHFVNPFAGELRQEFNSANKDLIEGRYAEGAQGFADLYKRFPSLPPLALLAAKAYAKDDKRVEAVEMIASAIKSGWWSKTFLENEDDFRELLDDERLIKLLPMLVERPIDYQGPVGFSQLRGWTSSGHPVPAKQGGIPYLLSCSLAIIRKHGSTVDQAIDVLRRAAKADGTNPSGQFWFAANSDVRAKTRLPNVPSALSYLRSIGKEADTFDTNLPARQGDVAGLMVGRANVNLKNRPWKLVPGAIAENLTSFGGVYSFKGHTKITDFLHAGAAMSSGTVAEPYSLQYKFPLPIMYGYYADGVSAIEAFYLSVSSPYQLLIVGDPLCQPFAQSPREWVDLAQDERDPGKIIFTRHSLGLKGRQTPVRSIEFFIHGRFVRAFPPAARGNLNINNASGAVEIRAVLVGQHPTEPRLSFSRYVDVKGALATPVAAVAEQQPDDEAQVVLSLTCQQADEITVRHLGEQLATIQAGSGDVTIDASSLGDGPLRLQPVARFGDKWVAGEPVVARKE